MTRSAFSFFLLFQILFLNPTTEAYAFTHSMENGDEPPVDDPGAPLASEGDEKGHHEAEEDSAIIISSDDEQPAAKTISKTKKAKTISKTNKAQPVMKAAWILTYRASDKYITPQMLKDGHLVFDECHSTKERVCTITYIHLTKRERLPTIEKFMRTVKAKHGIVQTAFCGYDSIACSSKKDEACIVEHVGFKLLLDHYIVENPAFVPWTNGFPVLNPTGRLMREAVRKGHPVPQDETSEFDVVKKRRIMDSIPVDDNDDPTALAAFEDFERNVLPAMERIQELEDLLRRVEIMEMKEDKRQGKTETAGGVYFAWSSCLGCMKIGATRRESPDKRLREISRFVTEKFILAAWVPTPNPFKLEKAAHLYFEDERINSRRGGSGAGTEFFKITSAEAVKWKKQQ
jgi:hypothetical protein